MLGRGGRLTSPKMFLQAGEATWMMNSMVAGRSMSLGGEKRW